MSCQSTSSPAYFIVSESLTNASKYAEASAVRIRVAPEAGAILVEVADDGCGGAKTAAGTGLRGLADRIDAFGRRGLSPRTNDVWPPSCVGFLSAGSRRASDHGNIAR